MHVGVDGGKALADTMADINCYVSVVKIRGCKHSWEFGSRRFVPRGSG